MSKLVKSFNEKLSKIDVLFVGAYYDLSDADKTVNYIDVKGGQIPVANMCKTIVLLKNKDELGLPFEFSYGLGYLKTSLELKKERYSHLEKDGRKSDDDTRRYASITPCGYVRKDSKSFVPAEKEHSDMKVPIVKKEELVASILSDVLYMFDELLDDEALDDKLVEAIKENRRKLQVLFGFKFTTTMCRLLLNGPDDNNTDYGYDNPYFLTVK